MRLATLRRAGAPESTFAALIIDGTAREMPGFADVGAFLAAPAAGQNAAANAARNAAREPVPVADARFAPLVVNPSKVFCIGLNYRNHIAETGQDVPAHPTVFTKFAASLTGAFDPVEVPAEDPRIDWEGELAVVIGTPGRRIAAEDAAGHIAGYAVSNDVSMRGWQGRTPEWTQGKCWESASPVGPYLLTADEFNPRAQITTRVNGAVMQQDSVADLVFPPAVLVAYLSTMVTLEPGDLILTGTPAGVALGRKDGNGRRPWLKAGDVLETEIEGLGAQRNVFF